MTAASTPGDLITAPAVEERLLPHRYDVDTRALYRAMNGRARSPADIEGVPVQRPVFIVGCPRSGTTLLYSLLMAAGGFACYRKETYFYDVAPRFGRLQTAESKRRLAAEWMRGYLGAMSGIDVEPLVHEALAACLHRREFLPRLMDAVARAQGCDRWLEGTPIHALYLDEVKRARPDALILHVIRDGRDCALSYERQGWTSPFPWDHLNAVGVAALYWEWIVRTGRRLGTTCAPDYLEVRFEDLVDAPQQTLAHVGRFIGHELDHERIMRHPVHAMLSPNTSFRHERRSNDFNPARRWRRAAADAVQVCEMLVGDCLEELGYPLSDGDRRDASRVFVNTMRATYLPYFVLKQWCKHRTPLGPLVTTATVWGEQPHPAERAVGVLQPRTPELL